MADILRHPNTSTTVDRVDRDVRKQLSMYLGWARALRLSMDTSLASAKDDLWKHAGFKQFARKYNEILTAVGKVTKITAPVDLFALDKIPGPGDAATIQQREYYDLVHANLSILVSFLEDSIGLIQDEIEALKDFLQARLRQAIFTSPDREEQVQDAIESLLIGRGLQKGIDYDRETGRVKVSVKESVPDFVFPRLALAVEVKLLKEQARIGSVVDQINADIRSYATKYEHQLFVVYDRGIVQNETEFKTGLEQHGRISVVIVKH